MLNSQYRMTPEISHFPSSQFYDSELKDGSNVRASDYGIVFANALPYGAYAFLNCGFGAEAVVTKLLNSLRKGTDSDRRSKKSHKT
jgi:hypothetical protein